MHEAEDKGADLHWFTDWFEREYGIAFHEIDEWQATYGVPFPAFELEAGYSTDEDGEVVDPPHQSLTLSRGWIRWSARLGDSYGETAKQTPRDLLPRIEAHLLARMDGQAKGAVLCPPRPPGSVSEAGSAFWRAVENNDEAKAAWERARRTLQAFAEAVRAVGPRHKGDDLRDLAESIRKALSASGRELEAAGFRAPELLQDWEHLAHVVEIPLATIRSGEYTLADVQAVAFAWVDRQRLLREQLAGATPSSRANIRPAVWFDKATGGLLTADVLLKAAVRKRLRCSRQEKRGAPWFHSIEEVKSRYPHLEARIEEYIKKERERTTTDKGGQARPL